MRRTLAPCASAPPPSLSVLACGRTRATPTEPTSTEATTRRRRRPRTGVQRGDRGPRRPRTSADRVTFRATVTPNGERVEVPVGEPVELIAADQPGEIHVHSTPEQEIEYPKGTTSRARPDRPAGRGRRRVARPRAGDRPARGPLSAGPRTASPSPTASAAPRTCRSRPSWRSPGAVAALAVSFTVLAVAWRSPRYDAATSGRPAPAWLATLVDSTWFGGALRCLDGLAVAAYAAFAAVSWAGPADQPVLRHLLRAGGGSGWSRSRCCSARSGRRSARSGRSTCRSRGSPAATPSAGSSPTPPGSGYWPAALGLFAFVWLELVYPYSTELGPVRLWCAVYVAIMLLGGALFGNTFYDRADPFEVYSSLVAKLSVWGRRGDRLVSAARWPTSTRSGAPRAGGGRRCCSAARRSTRSQDSTVWVRSHPVARPAGQRADNLALLGFCVAVGAIFALGCIRPASGTTWSATRPQPVRALGRADHRRATSWRTT